MTELSPRAHQHIRGARRAVIPLDAVDVLAGELDRALGARRFRVETHPDIEGLVRFYRRGSHAGDLFIGGSGLSAFTRTLGPFLSVRGGVVLQMEPTADGRARTTVSLIFGAESVADVTNAADHALAAIGRLGVPVHDEGWIRAVDVPEASAANPTTAAALGLH